MREQINRIAAIVMLLVYSGSFIGAEELNQGLEEGRVRLERYLDRAGQERSEESWQRKAEEGLAVAMSTWENRNAYLKETDGEAWQRGRQAAQEYYGLTQEERYVAWVCERMGEERSAADSSRLAQILKEAAAKHKEENLDLAGAEKAAEEWEAEREALTETYVSGWEKENGYTYGELAERLGKLNLSRERTEEIINESADMRRAELEEEAQQAGKKEGSRLLLRALYDRKSLKEQSAGEAAGRIVRELGEEAGETTKGEMDRLFADLDKEIEGKDAEEIKGEQEAWLERFRASFNRGLAKWESAESRFLSARSEWEKEAVRTYTESESVWGEAYLSLKEKRSAWEKDIETRISEAKDRLRQESSDYEKEIAQTLSEYQSGLAESAVRTDQLAGAQISIYENSRKMLAAAKNGMESWGALWSGKYDGVYSYWKTEAAADLAALLKDDRNADLKKINGKYIEDMRQATEAWNRLLMDRTVDKYNAGVSSTAEKNRTLTEKINKNIRKYIQKTETDDEGYIIHLTPEQLTEESSISDVDRLCAELLKAVTPDEIDVFNRKQYLKREEEITSLRDQLKGQKATAAALNQYRDIRTKLDSLYAQGKYSDIEAYTGQIHGCAVLAGVGDFVITASELESGKELNAWLVQAQSYREQTEEALKNLYVLTGQAGTESGGGFLSEAEKELCRAKALESQRSDEKKIAEAVNAYAEKTDSGRESREKTEQAVREAAAAYDSAYEAYGRTLAELEKKGKEMDSASGGVEKARAELEKKSEAVEAAKKEYRNLLAIAAGVSSETVVLQLSSLITSYQEHCTRQAEAEKNLYGGTYAEAEKKEEAAEAESGGAYREGLEKREEELKNLLASDWTDGNAEETLSREGETKLEDSLIQAGREADGLVKQYKKAEKAEEKTALEKQITEKTAEIREYLAYLYTLIEIKRTAAGGAADSGAPAAADFRHDDIEKQRAELEKEGSAYNEVKLAEMHKTARDAVYALMEKNKTTPAQAGNGTYRNVLEYIAELEGQRGMLSSAAQEALDGYISAYIAAESIRYVQETTVYDANVLQKREEETGRICTQTAEKFERGETPDAEEQKAYTEASPEYEFLKAVRTAKGSTENGWAQRLLADGYQNSSVFAENDRTAMKETLEQAGGDLLKNKAAACGAWEAFFDTTAEQKDGNTAAYVEEQKAAEDVLLQIEGYTRQFELYSGGADTARIAVAMKCVTDAQEAEAGARKAYSAAAEKLQDACSVYNRQADICSTAYRSLDEKRLEKRKTEAVRDWASGIYLENMGQNTDSMYETPKEQLSAADYAWLRSKISVEVLEELLGSGTTGEKNTGSVDQALAAYEKADRTYYSAMVLSYEADIIQKEQTQKVSAAETAEQNARLKLVRGTVYVSENALVTVTRNGDGSWNVSLNKTGQSNAAEQKAYFDDKTYVKKNTVNSDELYSHAENDMVNWYRAMVGDYGYYENIVLAALYIQSQHGSSAVSKSNPDDNDCYRLDGVPDTKCGSSWRYHKFRNSEVQKAYEQIQGHAGWESDVAKCILYRSNTAGKFPSIIERMETKVLECRAMDDLADDEHDLMKRNSWKVWGHRFYNSTGREADVAEDRVNDLKKQRQKENAEMKVDQEKLLDDLAAAEKDKSSEVEALNRIRYGSSSVPAEKLPAAVVKQAILGLLPDTSTVRQLAGELCSVLTESGYTSAYTAIDAMKQTYLDRRNTAQQKMLKVCADEAGEQAQKAAAYEETVNSARNIGQEDRMKLKELALRASDTVLSLKERSEASAAYDRLYAEINGNTEKLRSELKKQAQNVWGYGTYNSETYFKSLLEYYAGYADGTEQKSLTDINRETENYYSSILDTYRQMVKAGVEARNRSMSEAYRIELERSYANFLTGKQSAVDQINTVASIAENEWNRAEAKLRASHNSWKRDFLSGYRKTTGEWKENYEGFLEKKQAWMDKSYQNAAAGAGEKTLAQADSDVDAAVAQAEKDAAGKAAMERTDLDADKYVQTLLGESGIEELTASFADLESRVKDGRTALQKAHPRESTTQLSVIRAKQTIAAIEKDMKETSAKLAAYQAKEMLAKTIENYMEKIKESNGGWSDWEKNMVRDAGYEWGNDIKRRVITGATLFSNSYSTQNVHKYEDFTTAKPVVKVNLDNLNGLDSEGIMLVIAEAERELETWGKGIFGKEKEYKKGEGNDSKKDSARDEYDKLKEKGYEKLNVLEQDRYAELAGILFTSEGGTFSEHTGKAAVFRSDVNAEKSRSWNVKDSGSGELGLIMLDFQWKRRITLNDAEASYRRVQQKSVIFA